MAHVAPSVQFPRATHRSIRPSHFLAPLALAAVVAAIVLVVVHRPKAQAPRATSATRVHRHLPPYWTVRPGDTYTTIAARTGLTIADLQMLNPAVDPVGIYPGERLNLWRHPPTARPKPLGPQFWTVRPGQSFGLIAAKTKISLATLEQLNPKLKPSTLQPGDRVRLRR